MDIGTIILWAIIIGIGLTFGQMIVSLILMVIMFAIAIVSAPFVWVYNKIKGE